MRDITPDAVDLAADAPRLPNTICLARPARRPQTLVIRLDLAGIAVSAGSACSSGKIGAQPCARGDGRPAELADAAIRISLGWSTTDADIDALPRCLGALAAARSPRHTSQSAPPARRPRPYRRRLGMAAVQETIEQVQDRRRPVQVRLRDRRSRRSRPPRASTRTSCASSRLRRTSRRGCSSGGSRPIGAGDDDRADLGQGAAIPRSTSRISTTTPRPRAPKAPRAWTRSIPSCWPPTPSSAFP